MEVVFDKDGSVDSFAKLLKQIEQKGAKSALIFSCDENDYTKNGIDEILKECSFKIFGGVFPQIIFKDKNYSKGNLALLFDEDVEILVLQNISTSAQNIKAIDEFLPKNLKTAFVFVDAFSKAISDVVEELYYTYGAECKFLGGGAGSLNFVQKEVIFSNDGFLKDSCVIAFLPFSSNIGVEHGWEAIGDFYQITKAKKNVIYGIDHRRAFDVYKEVVEAHSGKKFDEIDFFELAKGYPLGVNKLDSEMVVRDPIATEDGALICVGNVYEREYIKILHGKKENLISATKEISELVKKSCVSKDDVTIFIDCISRVLFLEDDFDKEIRVVYENYPNLIGALTLGEIANSSNEMLEFYNKTAVVAVINDK